MPIATLEERMEAMQTQLNRMQLSLERLEKCLIDPYNDIHSEGIRYTADALLQSGKKPQGFNK